MYIFVNEELDMSRGKLGAQTGHAAVEAFNVSSQDMIDEWYLGGHYTKLIMSARNAEHLRTIERYLNDRGFETALVIDEGRTEITPLSATALGVEVVDRDDPHTKATFQHFDTLKDPPKEPVTVYNYFNTGAEPQMRLKQIKPDLVEEVLRPKEEAQAKAGPREPIIDDLMKFVHKVSADPTTSIDTLLEIRKLFLKK